MKALLLCLSAAIIIASFPVAAQVAVQGYFRKDGTYVSPHVRTRPDSSCANNYSGC